MEKIASMYINEPTVCGVSFYNEPYWNMTPSIYVNALSYTTSMIHSINPNLLLFVQVPGSAMAWEFWTTDLTTLANSLNGTFVGDAHFYYSTFSGIASNVNMYNNPNSTSLPPLYGWTADYYNGNYAAGYSGLVSFSDTWYINYVTNQQFPMFMGEVGVETYYNGTAWIPGAIQATQDAINLWDSSGISGYCMYWWYANGQGNVGLAVLNQDWTTLRQPMGQFLTQDMQANTNRG